MYIFKENFPLFRYSMVAVTCMYLLLSFGHPDYWIAKVNVAGCEEDGSEFFKEKGYKDYHLLNRLSADAAPVMVDFEENERYFENLEERIEDITFRNFNLSRLRAKQAQEHIEF